VAGPTLVLLRLPCTENCSPEKCVLSFFFFNRSSRGRFMVISLGVLAILSDSFPLLTSTNSECIGSCP